MIKINAKDKGCAHRIPTSISEDHQEPLVTARSSHKQTAQEEFFKLLIKKKNPSSSHKQISQEACKTKFSYIRSPHKAPISINELCECTELTCQLLKTEMTLLTLKHSLGRDQLSESANPDAPAAKYQTIFKPAPHIILYKIMDYSTYHSFVSRIRSSAMACKMNDAETVNYTITSLKYSEQEL
jgi:hypothetical protein